MMSEPSTISRTEARTQAQRERILIAAHACFVRDGFHAASMATIAETAAMSPGLIYRYFANKNAIILEIIERQLEGARADIATLRSDADLVSLVSELFSRWRSDEPGLMNPVLMLEMTAESSRDPQIAKALTDADRVTGEEFTAWLRHNARREGHNPSPEEVRARVFGLRCFIGGLAIRAIREPDVDAAALEQSLKLMLPSLLSFRD